MLNIGTLTVKTNAGRLYLAGQIKCAGYSGALALHPIPKRSDNSPDFRAHGRDPQTGEVFELGAAWKKEPKNKAAFLAITIDGPQFAAPIHFAAFPADDNPPADGAFLVEGESWNVVWSRPRIAGKPAAIAAAADMAGDGVAF